MSGNLSLTETGVLTATRAVLGTFGLLSATGTAVPVIRSPVNRTPEPAQPDFVVMWPLMRDRLAMNVETIVDNVITGSTASSVLTVSAVLRGSVTVGQLLYGAGLSNNGVLIVAQLTGTPGGAGTYQLAAGTPNVASEPMACGTLSAVQYTEATIQLDVHGPASADNAQRITTLMRSQYAYTAFLATGYDVAPLSTTDPRMTEFTNDQNQAEERWSLDLSLQINPIVVVTQQFAAALRTTLVSVDTIP